MRLTPFSVEKGYEIQDDNGRTQILRGIVIPTDPPGVPAPVSSLFVYDNNDLSCLYQKIGGNDTDWKKLCDIQGSGVIGDAEDGDYTDGLFTDFNPATPIGVAVDRFNEVLASLAPPPAPELTAHSAVTLGVTAHLSFGPSNGITGYVPFVSVIDGRVLDINDIAAPGGSLLGVFDSNTTITGTLATNTAAHSYAYPANAFGPGDSGLLELVVNGNTVVTADLSTAPAGVVAGSTGSTFSLSAAHAVQFNNGQPFSGSTYRTGSYSISPADMRLGYNYVTVRWNGTSLNVFEWIVDGDTAPITAYSGTLDALILANLRYVSGVGYYQQASAQYDVILQNIHRNVYAIGKPVSFVVSGGTAASQALGPITDETDDEVLIDVPVIVSDGRHYGTPLQVGVSAQHPLKPALNNAAIDVIQGLWVDTLLQSDTEVSLRFNEESRRRLDRSVAAVNNYNSQADVAAGVWNSQTHLDSTPDYNNELLVYNGRLMYPTQGFDGGDFRNPSEGNPNGAQYAPNGNPNYAAFTGIRYATYYFTNNTGLTKANFQLLIQGVGSFREAALGPLGNSFTVEIKFPDGSLTAGTGWMDAYTDFATEVFSDGAGMRFAAFGTGRAMNNLWGLTVGTRSIAAGEHIIIRIGMHPANTGYISQIDLTWL